MAQQPSSPRLPLLVSYIPFSCSPGATLALAPTQATIKTLSVQGVSCNIQALASLECYGFGSSVLSTTTPGSLVRLLILAVSVRRAQVAN